MKTGTTLHEESEHLEVIRGQQRFKYVSGAFVILLVVVATVILYNQTRTNLEVRQMFSESVRGLKVSGDLMDRIQKTRLHSLQTLGSTDPNVQLQSADASRARDSEVTALMREHAILIAGTGASASARRLEERWVPYLKVRDEVLASVLEGSQKEALQLDRTEGDAAFQKLREAMDECEAAYSLQADARLLQVRTVSQQNTVTVGIMLAVVMLGAGMGLRTMSSYARLLRSSRERFELAVQGSSDGIWDWNVVTNEDYFSDRWCELLGYAPHELRFHFETWADRLHPDDKDGVFAAVKAHLEQHAPYDREFRMRAKSGEYLWFHASGQAKWDETGKPLRMAGSLTDITKRKQVDDSLRETLTMQRAIFDAANYAIVSTGLDGTVRVFNRAAEQLLGYTGREIIGRTTPVRWHDKAEVANRADALSRELGFQVAPGFESLTAKARLGQSDENEWTLIRKDGSRLPVLLSVSAMREDSGKITGFLGVIADITVRKAAETEMARLNRELVDASRQAGMAEVATGVLHNVGNVLNSVNVSAALVVEQLRKSKTASLAKAVDLLRAHKEDVGGFLTNDAKGKQLPAFFEALSEQLTREQAMLTKETQGLQQNIDHIKQIVAMQQSYAKVTGARENLAPHELVEDALRMASTGLARHQIEVVRQFEAVPLVLVDRHLALQILINLVNNAKQAMDNQPEGRCLTLRIAQNESGRVRVEVGDNGAGIAPENLTKIFQHGFTTKKSGHGFGLHSGANAAKEMGGSLTVQSAGPGTGATFILELPRSENATQLASPMADNSTEHASRAA